MTPAPETRRHRKSLRQSLKNLLKRRRNRSAINGPKTIGSGILRKADPAVPILPAISELSLFPDFESSHFHLNRYSAHLPQRTRNACPETRIQYVDSPRVLSPRHSKSSLLPLTRLSQFNLHQSFVEAVPYPQPARYDIVPVAFSHGTSRKASLVSLQTSLSQTRSTLRLRRSNFTLTPQSSVPTLFHTTLQQPHHTGSTKSLKKSSKKVSIEGHPRGAGLEIPDDFRHIECSSPVSLKKSNTTIKHFDSFCVLDTARPGYPVTATSKDLRFVFDVGEQFFLHNQECAGSTLDLVTGFDAEGNEITHLVLFSPLVSPSSGRSRFLLAALIDITTFLLDTASLPELEVVSEKSVTDEAPLTPNGITDQRLWQQSTYELSAEQLLGGCYLDEELVRPSPDHRKMVAHRHTEDIWLNIASEEQRLTIPNCSRNVASNTSLGIYSESTSSSNGSVVDSVLEEFISNMQQLYSDFFLLAKSPLEHNFYEICNVSPSIHASKEYIEGHLSRTPIDVIDELSEKLGGESSFTIAVKWGSQGQEKQLYCIPLFGQRSITWVCALVNQDQPLLW